MALPDQPIIIKRIKKGGHGHHGGAWKVAYADFVTAMMAFFLLLWLLNVTTPEQKLGLAEFFTPTIGIKDSKGIGFKGGAKAGASGKSRTDLTAEGVVVGQVTQGPLAAPPSNEVRNPDANAENTSKADSKEDEYTEDGEQFKVTGQDINQALQRDPDIKDYQNNILVQETPEGLKIDMIDDQKQPMFIPGGSTLTDTGKKVLDSMANIMSKTPNNIMIVGHTDAATSTPNPQYTNWELSADRANAARRFLSSTQLEPDRVVKVVAMADRELLSPQEPTSPRNRRVTVILMRGSYYRDPKIQPTTRALLSAPSGRTKKEEPAVVEQPHGEGEPAEEQHP